VSAGPDSSRAATDELLAGLRDGRWQPGAWTELFVSAIDRSCRQACLHPRALAESIAIHAVIAALGTRNNRLWTVTSWLLTASHLGMLEHRRSLGAATTLTLVRANLPSLTGTRWLPLLALVSDVVDGRLARALGTTSPFVPPPIPSPMRRSGSPSPNGMSPANACGPPRCWHG
jgi:hypothetical protein